MKQKHKRTSDARKSRSIKDKLKWEIGGLPKCTKQMCVSEYVELNNLYKEKFIRDIMGPTIDDKAHFHTKKLYRDCCVAIIKRQRNCFYSQTD